MKLFLTNEEHRKKLIEKVNSQIEIVNDFLYLHRGDNEGFITLVIDNKLYAVPISSDSFTPKSKQKSGGNDKKKTILLRCSNKVNVNRLFRYVYLGPRGGKYVHMNDTFIPIDKMKDCVCDTLSSTRACGKQTTC